MDLGGWALLGGAEPRFCAVVWKTVTINTLVWRGRPWNECTAGSLRCLWDAGGEVGYLGARASAGGEGSVPEPENMRGDLGNNPFIQIGGHAENWRTAC